MAFSNGVMFAIILATGETLHRHGGTDIRSGAQAARALEPVAGNFAGALFALGFVGSGLLAVPVLAGAGSVGMAGLLGRQWGFSQSVRRAPVFYGLVGAGTLGGTVMSLVHINPIKLLVLVAVVNGIAVAPFLVVVMLVSGQPTAHGRPRERQPGQGARLGDCDAHGRCRRWALRHRWGVAVSADHRERTGLASQPS